MSCKGTRTTTAIGSLLVVAMLFSSLLLLHLPTACARHVAVLKAKHGLNVVGEAAGKAGSSRPIRTVEMRAAAKKHRYWNEVHDMLRRDYGYHARGNKPVHNDEPLREDEP